MARPITSFNCPPSVACGDTMQPTDWNKVAGNASHLLNDGLTLLSVSGQRVDGNAYPAIGTISNSTAPASEVIAWPIMLPYGITHLRVFGIHSLGFGLAGITPQFETLEYGFYANGGYTPIQRYNSNQNGLASGEIYLSGAQGFELELEVPAAIRPAANVRQLAYFRVTIQRQFTQLLPAFSYDGVNDVKIRGIVK